MLSFFKKTGSVSPLFIMEIEGILGYTPHNIHLYEKAFTTRQASANLEHNNERLEFLGDAILGVVVADFLFKKYPYKEESFLTDMRSKMVCRFSLNSLASKLGLDKVLQIVLSKRSLQQEGEDSLGNCFEAMVGAMFIDKSFPFTQQWLEKKVFAFHVAFEHLEDQDANARNTLHSWVSHQGKELVFHLDKVDVYQGVKKFYISVLIDNHVVCTTSGFSKKAAINEAAKQAVLRLSI